MYELELKILLAIRARPGLKAKDIADQIGADLNTVNSALHGQLKGKVQQDNTYRWWPNEPASAETGDVSSKQTATSLARLSRYYLDCLGHDDLGGVSEFASSSFGDLNYVELNALPNLGGEETDPFESELGRRLLGKTRRDKDRQIIFLGYPVRLNLIRSRKGWEGFMVEPILLFPFQEGVDKYSKPVLSDEPPQVNFRALRMLVEAGDTSIMEEAIQLTEELGLYNSEGDQPEIEDLLTRLYEIRPGWDWREEIDPSKLVQEPPLSSLNQQGIYNRAILIAAERSPYTKGLEYELGKLQSVSENDYHATALGAWLNTHTIEASPVDQQPLLEVLSLNSEQRQAVRQALSNSLTVITGPPGTGKSQVVTSILVNAAWQGKTVLFASKNNKAIDVVETRVNALGPRPILLRLGANQYQGRLAEYLVSLLAAKATKADSDQYREHNEIHARLRERSDSLDSELSTLIDLRNKVDALEHQVEQTRRDLGDDAFKRLRSLDRDQLDQAARKLLFAIKQVDKSVQPLLIRLVWNLLRNNRFAELRSARDTFQQASREISLPMPKAAPDESTVEEWIEYGEALLNGISQVLGAQNYFVALQALSQSVSFEDLSKQRTNLTADLAENSESLWKVWLRLQPERITSQQRKLLGDYSALLQLIVSANDQNQKLGRDVFRRYYQLFPQIASILSCWAVSSLSARGRIPLDANFFDLLVIDEASQCDIASALPLLYRARRVVVIGDPMQLRHISALPKQQDRQLLSRHGLVDDFAGWAYSTRSLFDLASSLCRADDIVALRDHHRSHADIIEFSNKTFYEGRLRVATNYDRLRRPLPAEAAVRWIDIRGKTTRPGNGGALNDIEAKAVVTEIERLLNQRYAGSIGVVSPFRAQANRIRDLVYTREDLVSRIAETGFLVDTVHKFQGDERDLMIFSPVVSEGVGDGALGFLRSTPNLFNVAITRARAALIVVGDKGAALNCHVDYLARFAAYAEAIGNRQGTPLNPPLPDSGPNYPSVASPERVSEWEKLFYHALYRAGVRTIPQYSVEKYLLDFALLDGERRLNIEIDGERYHRNWDGELCRRDQIRNQRLMELGWDIIRFWVYQIRDDLDQCVRRVQLWRDKSVH